jgi:hypothetical protein
VKIPATLEEVQLRGVCLEKLIGKLITILTNKKMMAGHRPTFLLDLMCIGPRIVLITEE